MMRYVNIYYLILPGETVPIRYTKEAERDKRFNKLSKLNKIKAVKYSGIEATNLEVDSE